MVCHNCNEDVPLGARFCPSCGAELRMRCAACGAAIDKAARFCTACGSPVAPSPIDVPPPFAAIKGGAQTSSTFPTEDGGAPQRSNAERRQITIMFVDLVGSTALSRSMDPEELADLLTRYQRACAAAVDRFGGHVARFLGDGILVYFGYPEAHEDDPERALRAALAIISVVPTRDNAADRDLALRIGIATGLVVVGDVASGAGVSKDNVVGEAPNRAARLQSMADLNTIVIDEATRRRVGALFALTDLGRRDARGFEDGVRAWRVDGITSTESRFDAIHALHRQPLVGRDPDLALLADRWDAACNEEGQVVLIIGEAGVGKSALTRSFERSLESTGHVLITLSCIEFYQDTALYPFVTYLERVSGMLPQDDPPMRLQRLRAVVDRSSMPAHALDLLASLMGIQNLENETAISMSPQRRKEMTRSLLVDIFLHRANPGASLLLRIEDIHWIDPTSMDLIAELIPSIRDRPAMLVMTSRTATAVSWMSEPHVSQVNLGRLNRQHSAKLIERFAKQSLPPTTMAEIVSRAEGIPLFLEELVAAVIENQTLTDTTTADRRRAFEASPLVPTTLQGSLLQRLDRLPSAKELAQVCAVIGKSFSPQLAATVLGTDVEKLRPSLNQLVDAGLLTRRLDAAHPSFAFRHALMQGAVYDSLLLSRRREIHASIARTMEAALSGEAGSDCVILAHHFAHAQMPVQAVAWLQKAGQLAVRQLAVQEAAVLLQKGLELLASIARTPDRDRIEIDLQISMGQALMAGKGFAFPDVGRAFDRARDLCDQIGDSAAMFPIMFARCRSHQLRGELAAAAEIARDLSSRAEHSSDPTIRAMAHRCLGVVAYHDGRLQFGHENFLAALKLYNRDQRGSRSFQVVNNPKIASCVHLSGLSFALGFDRDSDRWLAEANEESVFTKDPFDLAVVIHHSCLRQVLRRDAPLTIELANRLHGIAVEQGFAQFHAQARIYLGWADAMTGNPDRGAGHVQAAIDSYRKTGADLNLSLYQSLLTEAHTARDVYSDAVEAIEKAAQWAISTTESTCGFAAEIHRLKARLITRQTTEGDSGAVPHLRKAIDLARSQQALAFEARATMDLFACQTAAGARDQALGCLEELMMRISPAHSGPDIDAVRYLARQLSDADGLRK